jgi:hypothetical protein
MYTSLFDAQIETQEGQSMMDHCPPTPCASVFSIAVCIGDQSIENQRMMDVRPGAESANPKSISCEPQIISVIFWRSMRIQKINLVKGCRWRASMLGIN